MKHRRTGGAIDVAKLLWQEIQENDAAWNDTVPSSIPSDRTFNSQATPEIEKFVSIRRRFCSFTCTQKMMKEVNFKKWKEKRKKKHATYHSSPFGISTIEIYETSKQSSSAFLK